MINMKIDLSGIKPNLKKHQEKMQVVLDEQVLKDSNNFIPKDSGNLEESGILATDPGKGEVVWDTPYAKRLYWHPEYDFSKDSNPNARGAWFESAKSMYLKDWIKALEKVK